MYFHLEHNSYVVVFVYGFGNPEALNLINSFTVCNSRFF